MAYQHVLDRRLATPVVAFVAAGIVCGLGCSARTLIAVDPCPDGGGGACLMLGDASSPVDYPGATLLQGLVGLWHFDQTSGSQVAVDSSGNGNDGTLTEVNSSTVWVAGGRLGNALALNGVGYVLVPPSPSIASIVTGVTMSAWVYLIGPVVDYGTALSRQIGTTFGQYYHLSLGQPDREHSLFITPRLDVAPANPTWSAPTPPRQWTHLAGTYDGKTATLYVDGAQVASVAIVGTFDVDTTPLILGGNGNSQMTSEYFPGWIDEIALYNRALNAAEIQQLARAVTF